MNWLVTKREKHKNVYLFLISSMIFNILYDFFQEWCPNSRLPHFKGWQNNAHSYQSKNNKRQKNQACIETWQGSLFQPEEWTSPPSCPSSALWVSVTVVFKWHIQINLFDKWKTSWDMLGHGDSYVANIRINHPCFSWDHVRLIPGCLWFRWERWEQIALLLQGWVRQIVVVSSGPEIIGVLQKLHKNITIHLCDRLIPSFGTLKPAESENRAIRSLGVWSPGIRGYDWLTFHRPIALGSSHSNALIKKFS